MRRGRLELKNASPQRSPKKRKGGEASPMGGHWVASLRLPHQVASTVGMPLWGEGGKTAGLKKKIFPNNTV